jgi:hypothetical protein
MAFGHRKSEIAGSLVTLLLGITYLSKALRMTFWTSGGIPGGGFLPTLLGVGMIMLSLLGLLRTLVRQEEKIDLGSIRKPLYVLLALVGYLLFFKILGYVLDSVALMWFLLWVFGSDRSVFRRAVKAAAVSVLIVALFYGVFVSLLALDIPVWPSGEYVSNLW